MALLSSDGTQSLHNRLASFQLFAGIPEPAIVELLGEANWFSLPGGKLLDREGENCFALFLVITGTLGVFVGSEDGSKRMVAQIGEGETAGEMALISREPPSAEVVALRDSELLRIGPQGFDNLVSRHPRVMANLMRLMIRRLHDTTRNSLERKARTFAIVPLQEGLGTETIAVALESTLRNLGLRAAVLHAGNTVAATEWLNAFEAAHEYVFYSGDAPESSWTQLCLRQADRVFLVARANRPIVMERLAPRAREDHIDAPDLLLLHGGGGVTTAREHLACCGDAFRSRFHVRDGHPQDVSRLARFIVGRSVSLVLGGGGARGFAHIGVAKALVEAGVPFDRLGGTSMGAIVAAGLAAEWSIDEMIARMHEAFVRTNPLSDYTIPLIALLRGRKVSDRLREHFGSLHIEDLPRPFFCVSSDLTIGRAHLHKNGLLWRALRASVALPGILPPVCLDRHLLVDGGVMNNLPVDIAAQEGKGSLLASDVGGALDLCADDERYGERPLWWLAWQRMKGTPSIVSILMRSGTVGSEAQRRLVREQVDLLFEPPLPDIGLRDWKKFDHAVAEGYAHAAAVIEKHGVPFPDLCEPAGNLRMAAV